MYAWSFVSRSALNALYVRYEVVLPNTKEWEWPAEHAEVVDIARMLMCPDGLMGYVNESFAFVVIRMVICAFKCVCVCVCVCVFMQDGDAHKKRDRYQRSHLRNFGYKIHKPEMQWHAILYHLTV